MGNICSKKPKSNFNEIPLQDIKIRNLENEIKDLKKHITHLENKTKQLETKFNNIETFNYNKRLFHSVYVIHFRNSTRNPNYNGFIETLM
jgi:predicted  nucleic acid-binding Zn-ribbon protein